MKALIFGATGQLGRELARSRWPEGWDTVFLNRRQADFTQPELIKAAVFAHTPDIVINAAAYTAVDKAEDNEPLASAVNTIAPGEIAEACDRLGVPLFHISTDYVFDGCKAGPYVERDPIAPIGVYGRSKALGEAAIRAAAPQHLILRTAWIFSPFGQNFVKTMLALAKTNDTVQVVADQFGSPSSAADIANILVTLASRRKDLRFGTYHLTNTGTTSWYGLAQAIFDDLEVRSGVRPRCIPIPTAQYPTRASRPLNSVLNCELFFDTFGLSMPRWQDALGKVLTELHGSEGEGSA